MKLFKSRQQRRFWRPRNERKKLIIFLTWKRFSTLQRRFLSKAPKGPDKTQETMENHATLVLKHDAYISVVEFRKIQLEYNYHIPMKL